MKRSKKLTAMRSGMLGAGMLAVLMTASGAIPAPLPAPNWTSIFSPDGKVMNLQGGLDAIFMEEKISNGVGVDMSVRKTNPGGTVIDNGDVSPANDLGNGYVWLTTDASGRELVYAGVEPRTLLMPGAR